MRKSKAIGLLKQQIQIIDDPEIKFDEWISQTSSLLLKIFPLSAEIKIRQLKEITNDPELYSEMSSKKKLVTQKKKANSFLNNYMEEIELLGMETNNKLERFFGSFRFWSILLTFCM